MIYFRQAARHIAPDAGASKAAFSAVRVATQGYPPTTPCLTHAPLPRVEASVLI